MLLVLACTTFLLTIPALVLLAEVLSAVFSPEQNLPQSAITDGDFSFKIIVPAHNEEKIIESTLQYLLQKVDPNDILVVADNCSDKTAEIVRGNNIEVLQRVNSELRGKGYTLAYAVRYLNKNPPDVLIFIDADCRIKKGSITQLASISFHEKCPVQCVNTMTLGRNSSMKYHIAAFAFYLKNFIRPLGLTKLGVPCLLTGTGMAIPWDVAQKVDFATGDIVEDMQVGIQMVRKDHHTLFYREVVVESSFPEDERALQTQRTRWEHGHLATIKKNVLGLLKMAINQRRMENFIFALELAVPPITLYVSILVVHMVIAITLATNNSAALKISSIPLVILTIALLIGWIKYGMKILPMRSIVQIPFFMLWKIPLYLRYFLKPENKWIKTERSERNET